MVDLKSYRSCLKAFMVFKNGQEYNDTHVFTEAELLEVVPEDIYRYFKHRAYGNAEANEDQDNPTEARSNAIKYWKKAISYFMPNNLMPYNEIGNVGNPTRHAKINKLIGKIKKKEAARLGRKSLARRALYASEFENAIEKMESYSDDEIACFMSGCFKFQYNMIARVDDSAKFRSPDMKVFHQYPDYGIIARLCWSKNVLDERDAPDQVLFGAMDHRYCALVGLGIWLEHHFTKNPENNEFLFGTKGINCPVAIKNKAASKLREIFKDETFNVVDDGNKGTHSMRKFAVTQARSSGCGKDDTDTRARWKGHKRQQDDYANVTIPYVDAKVAAALCKGGVCAYVHANGSGISNDWVLDYVVPHMKEKCHRQVCIVLGRALLWRIFDPSGVHIIPQNIRVRVMAAYNDLGTTCTLENRENPIKKIPLGVNGCDAELIIHELLSDETDSNSQNIMQRRNTIERDEIRLLSSQVLYLRR